MLANQVEPGDLESTERRRGMRIFASMPGRFSLADRRNAGGKRREFACRAVNISESAIALAAPVSVELGEPVIAHIERLGRVEGTVIRILSRGFVMSIAASEEDRLKLVDRIEWIEKHKNHDVPDHRAHGRFVPKNPWSKLLLADGTVAACHVIDLSETGAAIAAEVDPDIEAVLAVGTVVGRVVRRFAGGFALQFIQRQSRDSVEGLAVVDH
jgi:hypothetical protein